jgi:hypothetical protein
MTRGWGHRKAAVAELAKANPEWGATQIAHAMGVADGYVRAAAARLNLKLPKSKPGIVPSHGAKYIAAKRARAAA